MLDTFNLYGARFAFKGCDSLATANLSYPKLLGHVKVRCVETYMREKSLFRAYVYSYA